MNNALTTEIIKRIFLDVGIGANGQSYGIGLLSRSCFLDKTFAVDYDNGVRNELPVWSGKIDLLGRKIKGLLVDLTYPHTETATKSDTGVVEEKISEFALALQVDDNPIYLLRLAYDFEDSGTFLIESGENWIVPSVLAQAYALVGMETIVSQGLVWEPYPSCEGLFTAVSKIIEM